jgi:hypothetical protein
MIGIARDSVRPDLIDTAACFEKCPNDFSPILRAISRLPCQVPILLNLSLLFGHILFKFF